MYKKMEVKSIEKGELNYLTVILTSNFDMQPYILYHRLIFSTT